MRCQKAEVKLGGPPKSLRYDSYQEGKCVQIMHAGPFSKIQGTVDDLYENFLTEKNLQPSGYYHEIYLHDASRVQPKNFKMVIRQPVRVMK